jgi:SpoVK/Ycf46/Vps4 family AAA+-type ATPase
MLFKGLKMNYSKSELIKIMSKHTIENEPDLLYEIIRDFYAEYTLDDLELFYRDAGLLEADQERAWQFKAQQGPL